ncbi:integrase catalytic domain-containing protein [Trichonephila clavipes]|nr:integrase catalytic domain-containing protein [Trichonephila clavipes]
MERRFQVDKDFERQYKKFMIEYESLGHMMPVENNEKSMDPKIYFLPHHAVMKGKMLQPDLFTILVKFRLNEIAFSADIQQMYRQILIDQEDQNFQRIVWRESKDSPIREYKLCTVTYGTSAPYLSTRCLFQTGLDLERDDPAVSSLIKESFYIDDLMAGAPSSFIASLKRFCARRGAPKHIYCDNGTTFVGARRKLQEIFKFASKLNENEHFCYFLSQVNIERHFSPPVSPHFGGLWEAGVKSIKYHLKRVIGNTNLTFEEFSTLLTQVEAILNSRPLVSLDCDNDPDSLNILTPSHFLIGEVITSSPEHTNDDKLSSLPLGYCPKMKLGFWRKWKMDYLSNLQNRTKWKSPNHNFKAGEIIIIKEDNIPPATWRLGKVIETHPGKDGVVRVVTLRTVKGRFKRPIHKLCKLPLHQE